jgi:hypothetical protein
MLMSETIVSSDKMESLKIAHDLFSELLQEDYSDSPEVKDELEHDLKECEKQIRGLKKVEIYFEKKVSKLELSILEEALNNESKVHWTSGFIVGKNWQENIPEGPRGPIGRFSSIVSNLNKEKTHKILIPSNDADQSWKVNDSIILHNNIEEAHKIIDEEELNLSNLKKAYEIYPNSIKIGKKIIDYFIEPKNKLTGSDFNNEFIEIYKLLIRRKQNLLAALNQLSLLCGEEKWEALWKEAEIHRELMGKELNEIKSYIVLCNSLLDGIELTSEQKTLSSIHQSIDDIKSSEKYDDAFNLLINNEEVSKWLNIAKRNIMSWTKIHNYTCIESYGIESIIKNIFDNFIRKGKINYKNLVSLKNQFINHLNKETKKQCLEEYYNIPGDKQHLLVEFRKIKNTIEKETGCKPTNDELLIKLNHSSKSAWNIARINEMDIYENSLKGSKDIEEEFKNYSQYIGPT